MKKHIFLFALICMAFTSCYEGDVGSREDYSVSGHVYYPDSTPFANAIVSVRDFYYYQYWSGLSEGENSFSSRSDENGYYEVHVKDGGKIRISVHANYTLEPEYEYDLPDSIYVADVKDIKYNGKNGFHDIDLYTYLKVREKSYPYLDPQSPFVGDSVMVVARNEIQKVELIENRQEIVFDMEYFNGDTAVMFYIPETVSLENRYYIKVYMEDTDMYYGIIQHLRTREE